MQGVTFQRVSVGDVSLSVATAGPKDGSPVVLLHGFPESWYCWRHQIPALVEQGYRAIVPDLRGYGGSDKPAGVKHYGIDSLADDVAGLLDAFDIGSAPVVGHDWGGAITWHFGHRHPDRATRLCVMNCPHPVAMQNVLWKSHAQRMKSWYIFVFQLPWLPERMLSANDYSRAWAAMAKTTTQKNAFTEEDRAHYLEAWRAPGAMSAMINYYRASLRVPPEPWKARHIPAPFLLIWGTADHALGEELIEPSMAYAEDGRVFRIPGVSHWVNIDAPHRVNGALLQWLDGQEPH